MDFLKIVKRRSFASDVIYNGLNIALAVAVLVVVLVINSPLPAFLLIFLSKWRVLAVRPGYWLANIQANLVDIIVGVSVVILLSSASGNIVLQIVFAVLYVAWLLFLKPRTKRSLVVAQAGVAVVVGVTALYTISYEWPASVVVLCMWLIGYATARHVLGSYEEAQVSFLSIVWGLVFAEIGWVAYHWAFAYMLPGMGSVELPQVALIVLAISFVAERFYASYHRHETVRMSDLLLPVLLASAIIIFMLVFRNAIPAGGI